MTVIHVFAAIYCGLVAFGVLLVLVGTLTGFHDSDTALRQKLVQYTAFGSGILLVVLVRVYELMAASIGAGTG